MPGEKIPADLKWLSNMQQLTTTLDAPQPFFTHKPEKVQANSPYHRPANPDLPAAAFRKARH
ncbi:MAG: hypothetical protein ABIR56_16910 [Polaromonas sp.]